MHRVCSTWLFLLAFFAADHFVAVLDTLALIRLRTPERANFRRDLTDPLAVGAADRDSRRPFAGDLHVARDRVDDVVAVAELQRQVVALHRGAITDAVDFEIAGKAGRDAGHHVVDQGARRAPHRTRPRRLV